ncbi:MAG TPA: hypothetical protein DCE41_04650 [Cytophagales bacterium]|nr:hypothetical protein [Cytophagales bacterium]HAA23091.1 hypothetical protein [Cytophagales bacterium]HAP64288.1 hypothetical protein [Cytophagales bacterium]
MKSEHEIFRQSRPDTIVVPDHYKKGIRKINARWLREEYFNGLTYQDFPQEYTDPTKKIKSAVLRKEIERYKCYANVPAENIVEYGEPFFVDAFEGELSLVIHMRRKIRYPGGWMTYHKYLGCMIPNTLEAFGNYLNNYWVVPKEAYIK